MNQKSAVITGASGLIGTELCRRFVASGYMVYGLDIKVGDLKDPNYKFIKCDLAKEASIKSAIKKIKNISVVVNNAADKSFVFLKSVDSVTLKQWNHGLAVNLTSVLLVSKFAHAQLKANKGAIVNIASTRHMMSEPNTPIYSAAKGAIVSLTHSLAMSWGPDVRVNSISPGWVAGPDKKLTAKDHSQHPVGRVGVPEDIAELALYLSGDKAGFITGQDFIVDGGMTRKMIYV